MKLDKQILLSTHFYLRYVSLLATVILLHLPLMSLAEADTSVTTQHKIILSGRSVLYNVTFGYIPVKSKDQTIAKVSFFYYYRTNGKHRNHRPILFIFTGGPGASSIGPHLGGTAGPIVANRDDEGYARYPEGYGTNEYSILDEIDLVYVDPVKTGFSRTIGKIANNDQRLFSPNGDSQYLSAFIRDFLARYNRWLSPKFLLGGSYGSKRVAEMAGDLYSNHGILINGVILRAANGLDMLSSKENYATDAIRLLFFTKASYYKKILSEALLMKDLKDVIREAEDFLYNELMPFLFKIGIQDDSSRALMATKYSKYSGIQAQIVLESLFESNKLLIHYKELLKPDSLPQSTYIKGWFSGMRNNFSALMTDFPALCAAAWYRKLLPNHYQVKSFGEYFHGVIEFTINELMPAYYRNSNDSMYNATIASKVIAISGLPSSMFSEKLGSTNFINSVIGMRIGSKHLQSIPGLEDIYHNDVRFSRVLGEVYYNQVPAFNAYIQNDLRVFPEEEYKFQAYRDSNWVFYDITGKQGSTTSASKLTAAMEANPFCKILFISGYYDGNCDYILNEWQYCQFDRSRKFKNRIFLKGYESGHAVDRSNIACRQMNKDIKVFIISSIPKFGVSAR